MQFILDKTQKLALFEQAREQLLTALHTGKLRPGDKLPSVRQVAQRNSINLKTAFAIYRRLKDEGYIDMRAGSGAYVSEIEGIDLEQAYCLSIFQLIKSNIYAASHLRIDPKEYSRLVQSYVDRSRLEAVNLAVIECNQEQIELFASEVSARLRVKVHPLLLEQVQSPDKRVARLLAQIDYFATTHFHFKEVKRLVARYGKSPLQLRLNPAFIPGLVGAAHRGQVLMVVSNANYFPMFRRALLDVGTPVKIVERITAVDHASPERVREAALRASAVYISPICDPRVRKALPPRINEIKFESMLSRESFEMLEAVMLFHSGKSKR
ncbi:MAG TPA: GntR family transcriptional regulator [Blastocatellia bacterium]|nr:GntR family transcriptional regulator [Blastocatellia bacterium]